MATLTTTSQEYQLNYDVLDFEIGKQFALSDSASLRLSAGLRYAALEDNYQTSISTVGGLVLTNTQKKKTTSGG